MPINSVIGASDYKISASNYIITTTDYKITGTDYRINRHSDVFMPMYINFLIAGKYYSLYYVAHKIVLLKNEFGMVALQLNCQMCRLCYICKK